MSSDPIEILIGLPIWILIILFSHPVFLIAVVFLIFRWARHGRRPGMARKLLLFLAVGSTAFTAFFVYMGFDIRWSTDGPGLLLVFMGIGGFGLLAIVTWILWAVRTRQS